MADLDAAALRRKVFPLHLAVPEQRPRIVGNQSFPIALHTLLAVTTEVGSGVRVARIKIQSTCR